MEEENKQEEPKEKKKLSKKTIIILVIVAVVACLAVIGFLSEEDYDDEWWDEYPGDITEIVDENPISVTDGTLYNKVSLMDSNARIVAFEGLIPQGWTANIESNWQVVSSDCPGVETVTLVSPDGNASIVIDSQQVFAENSQYAEGVNYDYYTTYLHYMDADTFVQYYMDSAYPGNNTLIADLEDDADLLQSANDCTDIFVQYATQNSEWINTMGYGLSYSVTAVPATMSKRQYQVGSEYLEGSCVIMATDSVLTSQYVAPNKTRTWRIPYSIVYKASDKETFDKYYDEYSFIVANSHFTTDYYALVEYVSSCIVNSYAQYYNAKSQASLQAMNDYIDSNYSSTSSASTNEKVMEMWDDYINEVDKYDTLDGSSIKTSMYNETVAQNGDTFYVGSKTGIPSGFTELSKSY